MPHRPERAGRNGKDPWAGLNPALYRGRGQTFAKHVLLKQYLQELAFKVLQSPQVPVDFLYLDGFSGPWQSQGESFEDTSFSIALTILTDVREALAAKGRFPQIRAVFVEERAEAFARLQEAVRRFPRIKVEPLQGRLEDKELRSGYLGKGPKPMTFMYEGRARASADAEPGPEPPPRSAGAAS